MRWMIFSHQEDGTLRGRNNCRDYATALEDIEDFRRVCPERAYGMMPFNAWDALAALGVAHPRLFLPSPSSSDFRSHK